MLTEERFGPRIEVENLQGHLTGKCMAAAFAAREVHLAAHSMTFTNKYMTVFQARNDLTPGRWAWFIVAKHGVQQGGALQEVPNSEPFTHAFTLADLETGILVFHEELHAFLCLMGVMA
jgi:hypothetical protein